ncbi:MAG: GIY-YIG nuclease family protein [Anaerolineae bacterium]|nr:GIY-YIG nuclease family protein [Anaerolineae bacterium]
MKRERRGSGLRYPDSFNGNNFGCVYVFETYPGFYKIGKTENYEERAHIFDVMSPFPLIVHAVIETRYMDIAEKVLHDHFEMQRVRGEWFRLSLEQLNVLSQIKGYDGRAWLTGDNRPVDLPEVRGSWRTTYRTARAA